MTVNEYIKQLESENFRLQKEIKEIQAIFENAKEIHNYSPEKLTDDSFCLGIKIEEIMKYIISLDSFSREFTTANYFIREGIKEIYQKGYDRGYNEGRLRNV